jgi:hypothetical protein
MHGDDNIKWIVDVYFRCSVSYGYMALLTVLVYVYRAS